MLKATVLAISSVFVLSGLLSAQDGTAPHKRRAFRQHQRIEHGVQSGQLTKEEAQQLKEQQKGIKEMQEQAKADGVVTKEEKQQIRAARKQASETIYKEKHDSETKK